MAATTIVVRGAAVSFSVVFKDINGNTVNPATAQLRIVYTIREAVTTVTVALASDGQGNWTATWDSSPADNGTVSWWAQSGDPPKSAAQGLFVLDANAANPQS